mmetsp:Transcript_23625/g.68014  ORF Transcript_23625/g.68014 Transcript_23625/m.68014 type:complete len:668 (-) Transcript_23625:187-2190(-)
MVDVERTRQLSALCLVRRSRPSKGVGSRSQKLPLVKLLNLLQELLLVLCRSARVDLGPLIEQILEPLVLVAGGINQCRDQGGLLSPIKVMHDGILGIVSPPLAILILDCVQGRIGHLQILGCHHTKSIREVGLGILLLGSKVQPQSGGGDGEQSGLLVADAKFGGTGANLVSCLALHVHPLVAQVDGTLPSLIDAGGDADAGLVELSDAGAASWPPFAPCLGTIEPIKGIIVEIPRRTVGGIGQFRRQRRLGRGGRRSGPRRPSHRRHHVAHIKGRGIGIGGTLGIAKSEWKGRGGTLVGGTATVAAESNGNGGLPAGITTAAGGGAVAAKVIGDGNCRCRNGGWRPRGTFVVRLCIASHDCHISTCTSIATIITTPSIARHATSLHQPDIRQCQTASRIGPAISQLFPQSQILGPIHAQEEVVPHLIQPIDAPANLVGPLTARDGDLVARPHLEANTIGSDLAIASGEGGGVDGFLRRGVGEGEVGAIPPVSPLVLERYRGEEAVPVDAAGVRKVVRGGRTGGRRRSRPRGTGGGEPVQYVVPLRGGRRGGVVCGPAKVGPVGRRQGLRGKDGEGIPLRDLDVAVGVVRGDGPAFGDEGRPGSTSPGVGWGGGGGYLEMPVEERWLLIGYAFSFGRRRRRRRGGGGSCSHCSKDDKSSDGCGRGTS